jgi:hypothetical protein
LEVEKFMDTRGLPTDQENTSSKREIVQANEHPSELLKFLERVHGKMPDVPEEEAEQEILKAIQEVRAQKAKRTGRTSA